MHPSLLSCESAGQRGLPDGYADNRCSQVLTARDASAQVPPRLSTRMAQVCREQRTRDTARASGGRARGRGRRRGYHVALPTRRRKLESHEECLQVRRSVSSPYSKYMRTCVKGKITVLDYCVVIPSGLFETKRIICTGAEWCLGSASAHCPQFQVF